MQARKLETRESEADEAVVAFLPNEAFLSALVRASRVSDAQKSYELKQLEAFIRSK